MDGAAELGAFHGTISEMTGPSNVNAGANVPTMSVTVIEAVCSCILLFDEV